MTSTSGLTGQQSTGPDEQQWEILDPERAFYAAWNRGASYITAAWAPDGAAVSIQSPQPDIIQVVVDPCDRKLREFDVSVISSSTDLSDRKCLTPLETLQWEGRTLYLYRVD